MTVTTLNLTPPIVGGVYRHFKGTLYVVRKIERDADTLKTRVSYHNVDDPDDSWSRLLTNFSMEEGKHTGWCDPPFEGGERYTFIRME